MSWISTDAEKIARYIDEKPVNYRFLPIDKSCFSYFEDYEKPGVSIEEFGFSTIPELQNLLGKKEIVNSPNVDVACTVAVFNNKPDRNGQEEAEEYTLPTFIYNF